MPDRLGPKPAIKDPWAATEAAIVSNCDLSQFEGVTEVDTPPHSMLISKQIQARAADFVGQWLEIHKTIEGPNHVFPPFNPDEFDLKPASRRRGAIYATLVRASNYYAGKGVATIDDRIATALTRRGVTGTPAQVAMIHKHFATLPPNFPRVQRLHQMHIYFNAIITDERVRHITGKDKHVSRCHLCGSGHDELPHLYGSCTVVSRARRAYSRRIHYQLSADELGAESDLHASLLLFPTALKAQASATIIFNWAVWYICRTRYALEDTLPRADHCVRAITATAVRAWANTRLEAWAVPTSAKGYPIRPKGKGTSLGNSKTRTHEQKLRAQQITHTTITNFRTRGAIIIATDGSSYTDGATGAGALVSLPPRRHQRGRETELIAAIGSGTNNVGELWAIAMAVQYVLREHAREPFEPNTPILILTDSRLSCDIVRYAAAPRNPDIKSLAWATRAITNRLNDALATRTDWVAGHAGIDVNEVADRLANMGATRSRRGLGFSANEQMNRITNHHFIDQSSSTYHIELIDPTDDPT
jgi:ribonuclease HI